jgi:hypothetical protein
METVWLFREYFKTHTYGTLVAAGKVLYTIERPWLNNARNISCIPSGDYIVKFLPRSGSGKYRNVWHIQNVLNRSGVLIHNGNLVIHSRGCLILGSKKGTLAGAPAVLGSRPALRKLQDILGTEDFILKIR